MVKSRRTPPRRRSNGATTVRLDPTKEAETIAATKVETLKDQLTAQFNLRETELTTKIKGLEETNTSLTGQLQNLMGDSQKAEVAKANPLDDARDAVDFW